MHYDVIWGEKLPPFVLDCFKGILIIVQLKIAIEFFWENQLLRILDIVIFHSKCHSFQSLNKSKKRSKQHSLENFTLVLILPNKLTNSIKLFFTKNIIIRLRSNLRLYEN